MGKSRLQPSSRISRSPCSTASRCSRKTYPCIDPAALWKRHEFDRSPQRRLGPPSQTGMRRGGLAWGELVSGTTITVLRRSLMISLERIKQGFVLAISDPNVGSSRTNQTSPRRGNRPWLLDLIRLVRHCVQILLDAEDICCVVGNFAGPDHSFLALPEFNRNCLTDNSSTGRGPELAAAVGSQDPPGW